MMMAVESNLIHGQRKIYVYVVRIFYQILDTDHDNIN